MKPFSLLILLSLFSFSTAEAADFAPDFSAITQSAAEQAKQIQFSEEFITHLTDCSPYQESKEGNLGIETTYDYEIIGWKDDLCECNFTSRSAIGDLKNVCRFDKVTLAEYVRALTSLKKKNNFTLEIMSDPDYIIATGIIFDQTVCKPEMQDMDYTADLRENLKSCTAYEKTVKYTDMAIR